MPKIKKFVCAAQQAIEDDLRSRHGGMMTAKDVGRELGTKHHDSYDTWLSDVPYVIVNGRKRWRVAEVAAKIYRCTETPGSVPSMR